MKETRRVCGSAAVAAVVVLAIVICVGLGIRIYSVGADLKDNGGVDQRELSSGAPSGYDVVAAYPAVRSRR